MTSDLPVCQMAPPSWLTQPLRDLATLLDDARFVGGPVRDTLLGRKVVDLDMATTLEPDEVMARLEHAGIRVVPTGLKHGTVTAILDSGPVEITTLRRDVETDGRHAVVAFTTDWATDAARRDFTMNALYLDAEAQLWDPVGGLDDCLAGRIRFVGDPLARVAEDFLRILRFYRFQAHYGQGEADAAARKACRAAAPIVLARLSGERIRHELLRLLAAPDPVPAFAMMVEDGIWSALEADRWNPEVDFAGFRRLVKGEPSPDPIRRLAYLMRLPEGRLANGKVADWHFSNDEVMRVTRLANAQPDLDADEPTARQAIWRAGKDDYRDGVRLAAARQDRAEDAARLIAIADAWDMPKEAPLRGRDFLEMGLRSGPQLGRFMRDIEAWWMERDFVPDREACLAEMRRRLD